MKFQCLSSGCKKTFLYAAKRLSEGLVSDEHEVFETHVCPYCHGLDFEELIETVPIQKIVSLKSVSIEEVDALIQEGYEVREVYAKNAILQKKSPEGKPE
jgi:hypothetical protein